MGVVVVMGVYAVLWQQVLKRVPLNVAYANRAVIVIWSTLWGYLFWHESISFYQVFGLIIIIFGISHVVNENGQ